MLTLVQFFGFLSAALLITLSPGPDNLMVLTMGVSKGRKEGIVFGLGCAIGCLSHTFLAVIGVSAAIAASPTAFMALQIVGGVYLIWLGYQAMKGSSAAKIASVDMNDVPLFKLFLKGVFANAINPKVVLFFLSFLPQFVIPQNGNVGWQLASLGVIFTAQAALLFGALGYFSGAVGQWLNSRPNAGIYLDRIAGVVFVGLGLRLVFFS